jgi:hypothetical protein
VLEQRAQRDKVEEHHEAGRSRTCPRDP